MLAIKHIRFFALNVIFLITTSCLFAQGKLEVELKPINTAGKLETISWASLMEGGSPIDMVAVENSKGLVFKLQYDKVYTIVVNSKNYEKVTATIDTHLPASEHQYVYTFTSSFELVEKRPGYKTNFTVKPVFTVIYNREKDAFGVSKPYKPTFTYKQLEKPKPKPKPKTTQTSTKTVEKTNGAKPQKEQPKSTQIKKTNVSSSTVVTKTRTSSSSDNHGSSSIQKTEFSSEEKSGEPQTISSSNIESEQTQITSEQQELNEEKEEKIQPPIQKSEEQEQEYIKRIVIDNYTPSIAREREAKEKRNQIEMIQEEYEDENTLNMLEKAKTKRSFYEEYSNGQIELKKSQKNYKE